ncbi:LytTR family DNA-binding domain-containing protein [Phenylobacterium sp.]|uniref:LytTR family DNA-binding domain-containing protein n=1 Tax=Phenylobacterium sp. TaxID=1871053 RepID=UPI0027369F90|nr:LytTR family DNA-binding domain-containing protein [Phenylobacterium sp.]MDP3852170.1 LytTR family DNA-binding domain-containing protein [Phenylobacterium sp.]
MISRAMAEGRTLKGFNWGAYSDLKSWARGLTVSAAAGTFLALSGAFGTDEMTLPMRFVYWIALMLLGTIWGGTVANFVFGPQAQAGHVVLRVLVTTLAISGPFTGVVWLANRLFMGQRIGLYESAYLFLIVALISLVMTTINLLVERRSLPAAEPLAPPRFLERLPLKLRGAEVWAVESEDHYLRLHTSKGQDLILLRLADAVAELEGIEGTQVHRSWWVARDAIADAKRGDGRATLTLKDGCEVPVSRTYARIIREKGWI